MSDKKRLDEKEVAARSFDISNLRVKPDNSPAVVSRQPLSAQPTSVQSVDSEEIPHLDIDSYVVRQLGDQLITDPEQALLELIKNCYDADASYSKIRIDKDYQPRPSDLAPEEALGLIHVEDNGSGMDRLSIVNGWLVISLSSKRLMKLEGRKSPKFNRPPLGDKGLGRLGTMKLGKCLLVETFTSSKATGYRVFFEWTNCRSGEPLRSVPVRLDSIPASGRTGTSIKIFGLNEPDYWQGEQKLRRLESRLSTLICPFEKFRSFIIDIEANGRPLDLLQLSSKVRDTAGIKIDFKWDGKTLKIEGKIKLSAYKRQERDPLFDSYVLPDNGKRLLKHFLNNKDTAAFSLKASDKAGWYIQFSKNLDWLDLKGHGKGDSYSDPGPFSGSIDSFDLQYLSGEQAPLFSKLQEYRNYIKAQAGIFVYRDNFGIRMPDDWLGLGKSFTSQKGFYSLKPSNSIGYFMLGVAENPDLQEKSDREGFIENEFYRGFIELAGTVRDSVNGALNVLGRSYNAFEKQMLEGLSPNNAPAEAKETVTRIGEVVSVASNLLTKIASTGKQRATELKRVENQVKTLSKNVHFSKGASEEFKSVLGTLMAQVNELDSDQKEVQRLLGELAEKKDVSSKVLSEITTLEDRVALVYETVGIGLSAQALAHDVNSLVSDILLTTRRLATRVKEDPDSPKIATDIAAIRTSANAIQTLVQFVDPMLRTSREIREKIAIGTLLNDFFSIRGERLRKNKVLWHTDIQEDFEVRFNRGRLIQIFDNLTTNSEYWLHQAYGDDEKKKKLLIEVASPYVKFSDSGRGIRPDLEETLFDVFVTGKPRAQGQGLGLFITTQLLERESCSIQLDDERNADGRRFKFIINLSGAMRD